MVLPSAGLRRAARFSGRGRIEGKHDSDGLFRFGGAFRAVAFDRHEGLSEPIRYTRIQIESAVILASYGGLAEGLADSPEPFWQHVRDGLLAYQASASWDDDD